MNAKTIAISFRRLMFGVGIVLGGATAVNAEPELLFTFDRYEAGGHSPVANPPVEILLRHGPAGDPVNSTFLGTGVLWNDGDSGIVDFTSANDAEFDDLVEGITNGVDDELFTWVHWPGAGGGGGGALESQWGLGSPDLIGNEIEFIRLIAHSVSITPWFDGFYAEVEMTYEFWGQPIPEPSTLSLLAVATMLFGPPSSTRDTSATRNSFQLPRIEDIEEHSASHRFGVLHSRGRSNRSAVCH